MGAAGPMADISELATAGLLTTISEDLVLAITVLPPPEAVALANIQHKAGSPSSQVYFSAFTKTSGSLLGSVYPA